MYLSATSDNASKRASVRPRPALFRALGRQEPPELIEIDGQSYRRRVVFKHDSWAATALYEGPSKCVVCKFNRQQSILGLSARWVGRRLAQREARLLSLLSSVENVPAVCGEVRVDGRAIPWAVAHDYVAGHPLRKGDRVDDHFFLKLYQMLVHVHQRQMAYVDLHKRENILVGDDGQPYLIDFQVSVRLPRIWPLSFFLRLLQASDLYHFSKQMRRFRPDLWEGSFAQAFARPRWIGLHRLIAVPFRTVRRRMLVLLGIRRGVGFALSEHTPEEALRDKGPAIIPFARHDENGPVSQQDANATINTAASQAA